MTGDALLATQSGLIEAVGQTMRQVAADEILPRFAALADLEVTEKSPGELVTDADREAELALTPRLKALLDLPVVGEEATSANPNLVDQISSSPAVWLVDPIDGTANFIDGSSEFAVMVALVEDGETTASWILRPTPLKEDGANDDGTSAHMAMATAIKGHGARVDGQTVRLSPASGQKDRLRGVVKKRFLPPEVLASVDHGANNFASTGEGSGAAGIEYPALLHGEADFILYWRTLPWDHAPGSLFVEEAGGRAARLDGSPYRPGQTSEGLLVAHPDVWPQICGALSVG